MKTPYLDSSIESIDARGQVSIDKLDMLTYRINKENYDQKYEVFIKSGAYNFYDNLMSNIKFPVEKISLIYSFDIASHTNIYNNKSIFRGNIIYLYSDPTHTKTEKFYERAGHYSFFADLLDLNGRCIYESFAKLEQYFYQLDNMSIYDKFRLQLHVFKDDKKRRIDSFEQFLIKYSQLSHEI